MAKLINLIGKRFGQLVVLAYSNKDGTKHKWLCQCDCGNKKLINGGNFRNGKTVSCGCVRLQKTSTHKMSRTKIYKRWHYMLERCNDPNSIRYPSYGGRGIKVCERWLKFENFYQDMGDPPDGKSLNRINNDGDYCPENCEWATPKEQQRNTRLNVNLTLNGKTQCISAWAKELGVNNRTLSGRIESGWSDEEALTLPVNKNLIRNKKYVVSK